MESTQESAQYRIEVFMQNLRTGVLDLVEISWHDTSEPLPVEARVGWSADNWIQICTSPEGVRRVYSHIVDLNFNILSAWWNEQSRKVYDD